MQTSPRLARLNNWIKYLQRTQRSPRHAVAFAAGQLVKHVYQRVWLRGGRPKSVIFIVGCQRSGTSVISRVFTRDLASKVYKEGSPDLFTRKPDRARLRPLDSVKETIGRNRASLIVVKPLVETQNLLTLLDYFAGCKAVWVYRHYQDVASSNLKRFGIRNGVNNLKPIVAGNLHNWRSEGISARSRQVVLDHFSDDMNPYDAAALFWYVRNSLFFDLGLDVHPAVMLCRYETFVEDPVTHMKRIYRFAQRNFPRGAITTEVHRESLNKGKSVALSPEINSLCDELLKAMDYVSLSNST